MSEYNTQAGYAGLRRIGHSRFQPPPGSKTLEDIAAICPGCQGPATFEELMDFGLANIGQNGHDAELAGSSGDRRGVSLTAAPTSPGVPKSLAGNSNRDHPRGFQCWPGALG